MGVFLLLCTLTHSPCSAGDFTPDLRALLVADIIIATPEKWDGISRNWQTRGYVKQVSSLNSSRPSHSPATRQRQAGFGQARLRQVGLGLD